MLFLASYLLNFVLFTRSELIKKSSKCIKQYKLIKHSVEVSRAIGDMKTLLKFNVEEYRVFGEVARVIFQGIFLKFL